MNILIPHSWLKDYLVTTTSPEKIASCLSLCGASVERLGKTASDTIYDIEITTNRVDMMSVSGIARELSAILPQFDIKAKFKNDPYKIATSYLPADATALQADQPPATSKKNLETGNWKLENKLKVHIKDKSLCSRFAAVVIENVKVYPSPKKTQNRLKAAGIRSLNNVIDISNYLMVALGQPVHVFDYNKIGRQTMILRQSKKGEKLITLDGKEHLLPGGDIVIEDGNGALIDLCGIMGGQNSAIDKNTKKVLLFVQTYNPVNIRQTSMRLAHRTEAAQLFEKNIDPELVAPAIAKGINLFKDLTGGIPASRIYDIYPNPYKPKDIKVSLDFIEKRLGIKLQLNKVKQILNNLGFPSQISNLPAGRQGHKPSCLNDRSGADRQITITIPSWRSHDISLPEDIVEEVARIYGYHNLPSNLPSGKLPKQFDNQTFYWEKNIKNLLKNLGFTETYTYSLQSKKLIKNFRLDSKEHLKLKNPLSLDMVYLRTTIIPSLLEVIQKNSPLEKVSLFELAKVYLPKQKGLPYEIQRLTLATTKEFFKLKGIVETIFDQLNVRGQFIPNQKITQLAPEEGTIIKIGPEIIGVIGKVFLPILKNFAVKKEIFVADLNFDKLVSFAKRYKTYQPLPKYPPIIEHLTFVNQKQALASNILKTIRKTHKLIKIARIIDVFKNHLSVEIHYQSQKRSLSDKKVAKVRKMIVKNLRKLGLTLHGKIK